MSPKVDEYKPLGMGNKGEWREWGSGAGEVAPTDFQAAITQSSFIRPGAAPGRALKVDPGLITLHFSSKI